MALRVDHLIPHSLILLCAIPLRIVVVVIRRIKLHELVLVRLRLRLIRVILRIAVVVVHVLRALLLLLIFEDAQDGLGRCLVVAHTLWQLAGELVVALDCGG